MDDELPSDDERLRALSEKLREAGQRSDAAPDRGSGETGASGMALGMKYASEFAGAILVTTFAGYGVDHVAGTSPWGLLIGLVLGTAAGVYSIVQSAKTGMK